MGWFDAVATKYGCMVQGATQAALTCLDVLGYLDEIPVCTGYEIDGQITDTFPTTPALLRAKHVARPPDLQVPHGDLEAGAELSELPDGLHPL